MNKKELHSIFQGILNNDEEQFNKLFKNYQSLVYAVAFSILKNKEDSEEIVQNVFEKIWNMKKENLPHNYEASWLYTLTKNETLNFLRSKKNEVSIEELYNIEIENDEIKQVIGKESYRKIISKLEPKEQEIVSLKVLSDLSFKEISQLLNMPIGTVQWKYYKSMNTLKLLITNLSIFLITIGMFVVNRFEKKKFDKVENNNVENIKNITTGNNINNGEQDKSDSMLNDNVSESTNEIQNNIVIDDEIIQKLNNSDIGILSVSGIFLLFTIIFSIIFIKRQQKGKKKVSK